ncbi:hypothetical protein Sango_3058400 [Sesamum angolense]|uniref:Reverse transcriptase zinc-binding domain-containing protein n=1 Tax=Sesamum angolense TaxID=2727404 RepID=A0AAE1TA29_9LAMI|nr:hypothetical protein Sango_3058400 [Sesamum angolense]
MVLFTVFSKAGGDFDRADIPSIKILTDTLSEFATFSGLKVNPAMSQIILSRCSRQRNSFGLRARRIFAYQISRRSENAGTKDENFPLARTIGRGTSKGSMDQICKPKAEGGLGMRSLVIMNQALILKQMWRILQNDGSSIWVDWIQRYRLRHSTLWIFNRTTGSWCWKKMIKLRPILQRGVNYKVGDGSSFSLWQDVWHERGPLCLSYPRGIEVTGLSLSSTLSSVLQRNQWCWLAATDSDIAEIVSLLPPMNPSTTDTICWRSNSGKFTLNSAILLIQPPSPHAHWQGLLQGQFKISRHGFILWLAILESFPPWKTMVPRTENGCVLCGGQFKGIMRASKRLRGTHLVNAALRATLAALVYHIWAERNSRKFTATSSSAELISNRVLEDIRMRIMAADVPPSLQTRSLYRIWKLAWH